MHFVRHGNWASARITCLLHPQMKPNVANDEGADWPVWTSWSALFHFFHRHNHAGTYTKQQPRLCPLVCGTAKMFFRKMLLPSSGSTLHVHA
jgi:hypothetical protein